MDPSRRARLGRPRQLVLGSLLAVGAPFMWWFLSGNGVDEVLLFHVVPIPLVAFCVGLEVVGLLTVALWARARLFAG